MEASSKFEAAMAMGAGTEIAGITTAGTGGAETGGIITESKTEAAGIDRRPVYLSIFETSMLPLVVHLITWRKLRCAL